MPRWLVFLLFITVAVLIVGSVHYYFYRRLVVSPQLPLPWRTVATISLAVLAAAGCPPAGEGPPTAGEAESFLAEAEQILLPVDHVLLQEAHALPAITVVVALGEEDGETLVEPARRVLVGIVDGVVEDEVGQLVLVPAALLDLEALQLPDQEEVLALEGQGPEAQLLVDLRGPAPGAAPPSR